MMGLIALENFENLFPVFSDLDRTESGNVVEVVEAEGVLGGEFLECGIVADDVGGNVEFLCELVSPCAEARENVGI